MKPAGIARVALQSTPCKGCGKLIYFVQDTEGKTQVLDGVPPVFVQIRDQDGIPTVMRIKGFVSHFATCPSANEFSGRNTKGKETL